MFDRISILPSTIRNHQLNVGDLCEKMLYYKEVIVFAGKEELVTLFEYFEVDILIEYIKSGYLRIVNRKKTYGAGNPGNRYLADFFFDQNYDLKKIIIDAYEAYSGDKEKSKNVGAKLYRYVGIFDAPAGLGEEIRNDFRDQTFMKKAIIKNIEYYNPQENINEQEINFVVTTQADTSLLVQSNLDISKYPFLDPKSVLMNIGLGLENIKIAADFDSELSVPELNTKTISAKFNSLIEKASKSSKDIDVFQYSEFPDAPSLQQVINGKHKTTKDFLDVLKSAGRFKIWLNDLGEDNKLVKEYHAKIKEKNWLQSMPSKAGRFYLTQGASTILKASGTLTGILAGIGLSAFNTLLVEKLFKNWKPNQFIEDEVVPFLNQSPVQK